MARTLSFAVVVPPIEDFYFTPHRGSALGAQVLAGILETHGHTTRIFNFPLYRTRSRSVHTIPVPAELSYLQPFLDSSRNFTRNGFFSRYYRFGPTYQECAEAVYAEKPDAVFISLFAFAYAEETIRFATILKNLGPDIPIISGGPGISVFPGYFAHTGLFSIVCAGEAEILVGRILEELHNALFSAAKMHGTIIRAERNSKAEEIFPAWGISHGKRKEYIANTSLSRGCPQRCEFCPNFLVHGREFRMGATERWLKTLPDCPDNGHTTAFNFEDDNLMADSESAFAFLEKLHLRYPESRIMMENGIDFRFLDREKTERLVQLGMTHFNIALGSPAGTTGTSRNTEMFREKVRLVSESGGWTTSYCIAGMRGDSPYATGRQLGFLASLRTQTGISLFYPVPGLPGFENTDIFEHTPPVLAKGSSAYPWTGSLETKDMVTAFLLSRWINSRFFFTGTVPDTDICPEWAGEKNTSAEVIEGYLDGIRSS